MIDFNLKGQLIDILNHLDEYFYLLTDLERKLFFKKIREIRDDMNDSNLD